VRPDAAHRKSNIQLHSSGNDKSMILSEAIEVAEKYRKLLEPWCEPEMCRIAGSTRRKKPDVGDIEIVCVPRTVHLIPFVTTVKQWYKKKGEPTGRQCG
jgi:DNA polymerase/3'-5' exonuclease PolX